MSFKVYDGLLFRNKPSTESLGLSPIRVVYQGEAIPGGELPDDKTIDALGASLESTGLPVAIDIEAWRPTDAETVASKYLPFARRLRAATTMPLGYYNIIPAHQPGLKVESDDQAMVAAWKAGQVSGPARDLFPYMDIAAFSAYRWDANLRDWVKRNRAYAATIRAALPEMKLIPFVWFNFHDALGPKATRNTEIPAPEWRIMLEVVRQIYDGCILWGGYKSDWDPEAAWWAATIAWRDKYRL